MPLIDIAAIIGRAAWVRRKCEFVGKDPPYSTNVLTSECFPNLNVVAHELPPSVLEMVFKEPTGSTLFYNSAVHNDDRRVGIGHGCGHLVSDLRGHVRGSRECNRGMRALEAAGRFRVDAVEIGCDHFCGAVLVPHDVLDDYAPAILFPTEPAAQQAFEEELHRLSSRFQVPQWFMEWRLRDLELLRRTSFYVP